SLCCAFIANPTVLPLKKDATICLAWCSQVKLCDGKGKMERALRSFVVAPLRLSTANFATESGAWKTLSQTINSVG
ncbi:MAG: hypothetical protein SQA66_02435, partial [Candidatus Fervidibacter sacchari]